MGARVTRVFRNFNIENRVHREISRDKPRPAPRHVLRSPAGAEAQEPAVSGVNQKNETLLSYLGSVYVQSTDTTEVPKESSPVEEANLRPLQFSLPEGPLGLQTDSNAFLDVTEVPKGKLSLTEALKALSSHQQHPQTWTPEKVAQEYSLDLMDTKAALEFFVPFQVKIFPPKTGKSEQKQIS